jgi:predicted DNA-binding transcriptional regulator YafY
LPGVLETVQDAVVQQRQLQIRYSSPTDARARALTLHPLAFIQHGPVAYLVATAFDFADPRLYALHRVNSARLSDVVSATPADFSLDTFLADGGMQFGEGGPLCLHAVVSGKLACYLTESPLSQDQRLTPRRADRYLLTAILKDSWQLYVWILSQGEEIVVVQPAHLRKRIRESLQAALKNYGRS